MQDYEKVKIDSFDKEVVVLLRDDNGYIVFVLEVTSLEDHNLEGNVYEISSWSCDNKGPLEVDDYLHAYMKWDGCCHVWFGEKTEENKRDSYLHLCGARSWENHSKLMVALFKYASKVIKRFDPDEEIEDERD